MNKSHGIASLKRYFVTDTQPDDARFHCESPYHWMSLPGSGFVIVMMDGQHDPDPTWTELPHLLENVPAAFDGIQPVLGTATAGPASTPSAVSQTITTPAVTATTTQLQQPAPSVINNTSHTPLGGVNVTHTTYQIAKKLAAINRHFHP